jgi:huntingtin
MYYKAFLYQITLDSGASEKFVSLLRVTLETLSQLLEVGTLNEAGRIAEEVLSYLRLTVTVEPTATVKCVQQVKEVVLFVLLF